MIHTKIKPQGDGFSMLMISDRLALCYRALKRPGKGGRRDRIQCAYFGFDSHEAAERFAKYLMAQFTPFAPRVVVRESDRLTQSAWEVKVWEFDHLMAVVYECCQMEQKRIEVAQPIAA